ncbi:MAG: GNAT family N-acetyltransferase [Dehalococcoidia bacterium]|jgi:ribosomal protein S18 acetylase RimI-like enzyme
MRTHDATGQRSDTEKNMHMDIPEPQASEENGRRKPDIDIRDMGVDDIPAVFHLGEQVFTAEKTPTLYRTWDEFEVVSMFNAETDYCFVAEIEGRIIGFALGNVVEKKRSAWKYGYIVWLVVSPEFQRIGVAGRLFNKLTDQMVEDGVRMFLVDTEADNLPALQFFRSRGFGNPQQHIYMTYNPANIEQQKEKKRGSRGKKNGNDHRRNG